MSNATLASPRWLSLGPASRLVGVDPDTLRRWADDGRIEAYVTPGGHRRFERETIEQLVADPPGGHADRWPASAPARNALTRAYRRSYDTDKATGRDPGRRRRSSASTTDTTGACWSRPWSPISMPVRAMAPRATGRRRMPTALVDDLARRLAAWRHEPDRGGRPVRGGPAARSSTS